MKKLKVVTMLGVLLLVGCESGVKMVEERVRDEIEYEEVLVIGVIKEIREFQYSLLENIEDKEARDHIDYGSVNSVIGEFKMKVNTLEKHVDSILLDKTTKEMLEWLNKLGELAELAEINEEKQIGEKIEKVNSIQKMVEKKILKLEEEVESKMKKDGRLDRVVKIAEYKVFMESNEFGEVFSLMVNLIYAENRTDFIKVIDKDKVMANLEKIAFLAEESTNNEYINVTKLLIEYVDLKGMLAAQPKKMDLEDIAKVIYLLGSEFPEADAVEIVKAGEVTKESLDGLYYKVMSKNYEEQFLNNYIQ